MTVAVDTHGHNTATGSSTITIDVSAAAAGEIILVGAVIGATTTAIPTASISGAGLTWHLLADPSGPGYQNPPLSTGFGNFMGVWWAEASGAVSSQTVTVTQTNGGVTVDNASIVYASFSGVLPPTFDTNGSLPVSISYSNYNTPTPGLVTAESVISTDLEPDLLFCFYGTNSDIGRTFVVVDLPDTPGQAVLVDSANNSGGVLNFSYIGLAVAPSTVAESSVLWGCGTQNYTHLLVIHALVGATPPSNRPFLTRPKRGF